VPQPGTNVLNGDLNCGDLNYLEASHWQPEALTAQKDGPFFVGSGMRCRVKAMALEALYPFIGVAMFSDDRPAH
jgi:hypothetical protein